MNQQALYNLKRFRKINGKIVEDVDITEQYKNGELRIKINKLKKPRCSPFRRNHLLFTNKRRGYLKNKTIRRLPDYMNVYKFGKRITRNKRKNAVKK